MNQRETKEIIKRRIDGASETISANKEENSGLRYAYSYGVLLSVLKGIADDLNIEMDKDKFEVTKTPPRKIDFPSGKFALENLEIVSYSIAVPLIKAHMINDSQMKQLQDYLSEEGVPWNYVGVDDIGYLSVGSREMNMKNYSSKFLTALNKL